MVILLVTSQNDQQKQRPKVSLGQECASDKMSRMTKITFPNYDVVYYDVTLSNAIMFWWCVP